MKKVLLTAIAMIMVGAGSVSAQSHYVAFKNGEQSTAKSFNDRPKLLFSDGRWVLADTDGSQTSMAELKKISFRPVMKGDANVDEIVDVADITTIASFILGNSPSPFIRENADANDDDNIDVADITATAGKILGE